jgi:hypothetical protein
MDRGRVGEDRGSKEMDGCPLTVVKHLVTPVIHHPFTLDVEPMLYSLKESYHSYTGNQNLTILPLAPSISSVCLVTCHCPLTFDSEGIRTLGFMEFVDYVRGSPGTLISDTLAVKPKCHNPQIV